MDNIRNFCIIAHIDHGKSTLADRFLELTNTVEKRKMREQVLDTMDLERERGITIKLQPVRMTYKNAKLDSRFRSPRHSSGGAGGNDNGEYILNLIDTPGHVDFNYEVSRSLAAVEGAVLLVDATKGVQAQTLANLYLAIEEGLEIIPVVNKIDLPNARVEETKKEICLVLGCKEEEVLAASGKTGEGVEKILERVIEKVPPPKGETDKPLKALVFDSKYDLFKGVLAYVRVFEGEVKAENDILLISTGTQSKVIEVGKFAPGLEKTESLSAGQIGYIATGLKSIEGCRVGDTITLTGKQVESLPGYKEVKPMVYASLYPVEGDEYNTMRDALDKLKLNDAAFSFEPESNIALGRGFRCGFLGVLHLEIVQERLRREFAINPTVTLPSVVYELELTNGKRQNVYSPSQMPDPSFFSKIQEPYVKLEIITPVKFLGAVMDVAKNKRAQYTGTEYIGESRAILKFDCPLSEVITDMHDSLKRISSGYASMNYQFYENVPADLVKLDILVAGDKVEAFSRIVPRDRAYHEGKWMVEKLKDSIPRQNFAVALQAVLGAKVIARETIKAFRKDVIAKLYGGDVTRKRKLLEKQKKGKKRMTSSGRVEIPPEAFVALLKK